MSIWQYLKDQATRIALYLIAIGIVAAIYFLDANMRLQPGNLTYLISILIAILLFYLIVDYTVQQRHIKRIQQLSIPSAQINLPPSKDRKEQCYQELIQNIVAANAEETVRKEQENQQELEFLTLLAHRMKTPLTALSLITQQADADIKEGLEQELFRLQEDVDRMLYYARGREFSDDYVIEPASLSKIVSASIKKHAHIFIGNGIHVHPENLDIEVLTDRKWLGFIVDQLISNAVKYSHRGGKIRIAAVQNASETILTVSDHGMGIAPADLPRVTQRSFTGSNGRLGTQSTGMGLYLARTLARKLGHKLDIQSQKNIGTQASIHIPRFSDDSM